MTVVKSDLELNIDRLHAELTRRYSQPNVLTLRRFRHFEPLFQERNKTDDHFNPIKKLGDEYLKTVNPYIETHIVVSESDRRVILVLPPIFFKIKTIPHNDENDIMMAINTKMHTTGTYPPNKMGQSYNAMAQALINEQRTDPDAISTAQQRYQEIITQFNRTYAGDSVTVADSAEAAVSTTPKTIPSDEWEDL